MEELQLNEQQDLYNSAFPKLEFSFIYQIAYCHFCKKRAIVFCCYKNFKAASCTKKYCAKCLRNHYNENIENVISKSREWNCPYKQNACCCSKCGDTVQNYRPFRDGRGSNMFKEQIKENNLEQSDDNMIQEQEESNSYYESESSQSSDQEQDLNIDLDNFLSDSSSQTEQQIKEPKQTYFQTINPLLQFEDIPISQIAVKTIKTPYLRQVKDRIKNIQNIETNQSALEFNNYLIQNLISQRDQMTQEDIDTCLYQLYLNLKKLGIGADRSIREGRIVNENRLNKIAYDPKFLGMDFYNIFDKEKLLQYLDQDLRVNNRKEIQHQQSSSQNSHGSRKRGKQLIVSPIKRQERLLQKRRFHQANKFKDVLDSQEENSEEDYQIGEVQRLEITDDFNIIISKTVINYEEMTQ